MSDYPAAPPRSPDPHPRLRVAALIAVITGSVLIAAAAFVLSYSGIHQLALENGVSPTLARLYPAIFDAMLVIACAAALALRGARWWMRLYVWLSLLLLLAAVATGDAAYAVSAALPPQPSRAAAAVTPWVLALIAFGLWLVMLRQMRRVRALRGQHGANVPPAGAVAGAEAGAGEEFTGPGQAPAGTQTGRDGARMGDGSGDDDGAVAGVTPDDREAPGPAPDDEVPGEQAASEQAASEQAPEGEVSRSQAPQGGDPAPDGRPPVAPEPAEDASQAVAEPHGDPPPASFERMHASPTPPQG